MRPKELAFLNKLSIIVENLKQYLSELALEAKISEALKLGETTPKPMAIKEKAHQAVNQECLLKNG